MIRLAKSGWKRVSTQGLGRNSLLSMGQSLTTIICVFLSYRFLIAEEGLAGLGVWSLLMVFGGVASTFDVSGASALARSVARHNIDFADVARPEVVHTVLITSMVINGVMVVLFVAILPLVLPSVIATDQMAQARQLIPWVAGLMLVTPLAVGLSASIDGIMRADKRAILASVAAICGLAVAVVAIPQMGLIGIALSQAVQQCIVIIGGWLILRGHISGLGWLPLRWKAIVARRTMSYALKLNMTGALGLLFEPLTKLCINHAGGSMAVGIYELASRLVVQLRGLIIASASPLVPAFAATNVVDPAFVGLLTKAQRYSIFAAGMVALSSVIAAPVMSFIILGHVSTEVIQVNAVLAFGWALNLFSVPLYIAAQGQGALRWNIISHSAMAVIVIFSTIFIPLLNEVAIIFGVAIALTFGSVITIFGNINLFRLKGFYGKFAKQGLSCMSFITLFCSLNYIFSVKIL